MSDFACPDWLIAETSTLTPAERAIYIAQRFGSTDGDHHKMWVIDQMVRALLVRQNAYFEFVVETCSGEQGPNTYDWDEGIAP